MSSFKPPSFQDRAGQAADARAKALAQLRQRPEPSEQEIAERKAAGVRREAARAEKATAKRAAAEAAVTVKAQPVTTEAERKAARDARYAKRKARG
jgi:hypothetical protein